MNNFLIVILFKESKREKEEIMIIKMKKKVENK